MKYDVILSELSDFNRRLGKLEARIDSREISKNGVVLIELTPDDIKRMIEGDHVMTNISDSETVLIGLKGAHHV